MCICMESHEVYIKQHTVVFRIDRRREKFTNTSMHTYVMLCGSFISQNAVAVKRLKKTT